MNISDIFKGEHGMLNEDKLISLGWLDEEQLNRISLSEERLERACKELEIQVKHLYFDPEGGVNPFCYWDGVFYFRFVTLQLDYLKMELAPDFTLAKQFVKQKEHFYKWVEKEDWEEVISHADKKVSFLVFEALRDKIPETEQKALFLSIYGRNEYGFDRLNQEMVREVLCLPTPEEYDIQQSKKNPDADGYYLIYRGQTSQSTSLDEAYSWTLDESTAKWFANRFKANGTVLKAKVHQNHIAAYLRGRGESEVLVFPEHIQLVKE